MGVSGRTGQNPDRIRPRPDSFRTESGQNATMLSGNHNNSKECQGALFSQFSTCHRRLLDELIFTSGWVKARRKREKRPLVRERSRTESRFHSTWWFAGWPSGRGKTAPIHFTEFSSCTAAIKLWSSSDVARANHRRQCGGKSIFYFVPLPSPPASNNRASVCASASSALRSGSVTVNRGRPEGSSS